MKDTADAIQAGTNQEVGYLSLLIMPDVTAGRPADLQCAQVADEGSPMTGPEQCMNAHAPVAESNVQRPQLIAAAVARCSEPASTVQLYISVVPIVAKTTGETDSSAVSSDEQQRSSNAQPVSVVPDRDMDTKKSQFAQSAVDSINTAVASSSQDRDSQQASSAPQRAIAALQVTWSNPKGTDQALPRQDSFAEVNRASAENMEMGAPASHTSEATESAPVSASSLRTGNVSMAAVQEKRSKIHGPPSVFDVDAVSGATVSSKTISSRTTGSARMLPHDVDSSGQPIQHSQVGDPQDGVVAAKPDEVGALQQGFFATHTGAHGMTEPHPAKAGSEEPVHVGSEPAGSQTEQMNGGRSPGMFGINTARLIQRMGESEMQVGMHSSEFGDISIRTSVSRQLMQAQISVDHSELGSALSAHIPSIQAKLGSDYGLHASIQLNQGGASFFGEQGQSSQRQQRQLNASTIATDAPAAIQADKSTLQAQVSANEGYRLDIRA